MPSSSSLVRHHTAGRLEATRLAVRWAPGPPQKPSEDGRVPFRLEEAPLRPGRLQLGPFEVQVGLDARDDDAEVTVRVRSTADEPVTLESVIVGARWGCDADVGLRFLRHGWQSWSFSGGRALDAEGEAAFPSGPWVRGFHHALGAPAPDRAGWHESDLVSVAASPSGAACLAGLLERGVGSGLVYWKPVEGGALVEVEVQLEVLLEPGATLEPEPLRLALGDDENALLETYAEDLGARAGARVGAAFQAGWCSWYQFFSGITEEVLLRNLEVLAKRRSEIPISVVQLDDGYQRAIGDWLVTNDDFPRGLAPVAEAIRDAGFRPGIWTAPFSVVRESRVFDAHPEWLLRWGDDLHRGFLHPVWTKHNFVHVLDTSRDDVCEHLTRVFAGLTGMGFTYHKIDFLYMVAMRCESADPRVSRAGRMRRGLEAIRAGAGQDSFVLGCGSPMGSAVGHVDGMRIGPDVAPHWEPRPAFPVPGIDPVEPSTRNAIRNVLSRAWMHRRLWLNDPDCLMVRTHDTDLTPDEVSSLAAAIAATGGMVIFSDDVSRLDDQELGRLREVVALGRDIDAGGRAGTARALGLLDGEIAEGVLGHGPEADLFALLNADEEPRQAALELSAVVPDASGEPEAALETQGPAWSGDSGRIELAAHESTALIVPRHASLAVFCDFDGTFAVQDVGSTLAKTYASERRPALWERLRRGELTAWEYNMELLDGLELPEERLESFLRSVELDPGAADLVAFCEAHRIPFRVLSDGFDRNLDRLQELGGVRFAYDANRLWYEGGRWRLAPGYSDPECGCGTGTCKRARIQAFRAEHPSARIVHVGNGRVSDLCASKAADVVFAKDTLVDALEELGRPYERFTTLRDVQAGLVRLQGELEAARA